MSENNNIKIKNNHLHYVTTIPAISTFTVTIAIVILIIIVIIIIRGSFNEGEGTMRSSHEREEKSTMGSVSVEKIPQLPPNMR